MLCKFCWNIQRIRGISVLDYPVSMTSGINMTNYHKQQQQSGLVTELMQDYLQSQTSSCQVLREKMCASSIYLTF